MKCFKKKQDMNDCYSLIIKKYIKWVKTLNRLILHFKGTEEKFRQYY